MPAHATQQTVGENIYVGNLILPLPDTDFRDFLDEVVRLADSAPEIIKAIEQDLDLQAREKKHLRLADKRFFESQTNDLPGMDIEEQKVRAEELNLAMGRPRMTGYAVYVFLMIRGFLGSLISKPARRFLHESMSLYGFLQHRGLNMPAVTTIQENVNGVGHATRELIFNKQLALILGEELDDFKKLTLDSTHVKANSSWPTDAKILTGLLMRVNRRGQALHLFGLDNFLQRGVPRWLDAMDKLEFKICLAGGNAKSKGKRNQYYGQLFRKGRKAADALSSECNRLDLGEALEKLSPSRRILLERLVQRMQSDLADAYRVLEYASDRVFHDQVLPSTQKVLSLSDGSAAYIQKGSRNAVIGYKPQLVRSGNGFVTSLTVPQGCSADSSELVPAIADSIRRTGVVPEWVSTDDGYASAKGLMDVRGLGVKDVSISGSKGKKLTAQDVWASQPYQDARRSRSAVESLMFTIKDGFEFAQLARRGLDAVRDELLEKVMAYNSCRIVLMRQRRCEPLTQAA